MSLLSYVLISFVGFVVGRYVEDPKKIVQALDDQYAAYWNQKDYTSLADSLYYNGAQVIPPDASKFVSQLGLASWFPRMEQYWNSTLNIIAEYVLLEQGSTSDVIHEIGSYTGVPNKYYQRWSNAGGSWKIAFSVLAVGGPQGESTTLQHVPVKSDPTTIIALLDREFTNAFNKEDFDTVASFYSVGAHLIPPTCDGYIVQSQLAAFFKAAHESGISTIDLKPTVVIQENPMLIHEIGSNSINSGPAGPYYVRWTNNGTVWQLTTDIMSIGI